MPKLTLAEARKTCREYGFSLRHRDGEYRVSPLGAKEDARAYYTDDIHDAVETAYLMARESSANFGRNSPKRTRKRNFKRPFKVNRWSERDRLHIELVDADDRTVIEWWDDDAVSAIENGFIDPRRLRESVIEYAEHLGVI